MGSTNTTIVVPDVHAPFHDRAWWETTQELIEEVQPRRIVCIGDFVDCYSVSMHVKDPRRRTVLKEETDEAAEMLVWLRAHTKEFLFTEGNHENRLPRFIMKTAPELLSTHPTMRELLGVPEKSWVPYMQHVTVGEVSYTHELGHCGKGAISQTLDAFGHCIVFGHSHRAGTLYDGDVTGKRRFVLNVGWGGDVTTIDYTHRAKARSWQLGLGAIEQDRSGLAWGTFIPFVDGKMAYAGQVFGRAQRRAA